MRNILIIIFAILLNLGLYIMIKCITNNEGEPFLVLGTTMFNSSLLFLIRTYNKYENE